MIPEELAKYGPTGVAIALVIALVYLVPKFLTIIKVKDDMFLKFMKDSEERHCKAYDKLDSTLNNVGTTLNSVGLTVQENTLFMRNLNGKLENAIKEKIN